MSARVVSAEGLLTITASDTADNPRFNGQGDLPRAVRFDVGGTVSYVCVDGSTASFTVVAGEVLYIKCKRINSTGTTATGIVGYY